MKSKSSIYTKRPRARATKPTPTNTFMVTFDIGEKDGKAYRGETGLYFEANQFPALQTAKGAPTVTGSEVICMALADAIVTVAETCHIAPDKLKEQVISRLEKKTEKHA